MTPRYTPELARVGLDGAAAASFGRRRTELRDRVAKGTLNPGAVVPALGEGFAAFSRGEYAAAARAIES